MARPMRTRKKIDYKEPEVKTPKPVENENFEKPKKRKKPQPQVDPIPENEESKENEHPALDVEHAEEQINPSSKRHARKRTKNADVLQDVTSLTSNEDGDEEDEGEPEEADGSAQKMSKERRSFGPQGQSKKKSRGKGRSRSTSTDESKDKKADIAFDNTLSEQDLVKPLFLTQDSLEQVMLNEQQVDERLQQATKEIEKWKSLFKNLQQLRETEPEQLLQSTRRVAQTQHETQCKIIAGLKDELKALRQELKSTKTPRSDHQNAKDKEKGRSEPIKEESDELQATLEAQKKAIRFYQRVTGLQLSLIEDEEDDGELERILCTIVNAKERKAARFELVYPADVEDEVDYIPVGNAHLLPEYLQEEISFDRHDAPVLLTKIVKALYSHSRAE